MNVSISKYPFSFAKRSQVKNGYHRVAFIDHPQLYSHFMRLDDCDRRARFCGTVSKEFIWQYCTQKRSVNAITMGFYVEGSLRGACELIPVSNDLFIKRAEVAVSVESAWQHKGVGSDLFRKITVMARNRGITSLCVLFETYNKGMHALVAPYNANIVLEEGARQARIRLLWPDILSWYEEFAQNRYHGSYGLFERYLLNYKQLLR